MDKTPLKAIRENCIDCCVGQKGEVLNCHILDCPLYPYRLGKNPKRKRLKAIGKRLISDIKR